MKARRPARWLLGFLWVLLLLVSGSVVVQAQVTRDERIAAADAAWGNLEFARAQDLLTLALNPTAGPRDSTWAKGVQLLGQILLDRGRQALAGTWLRWGFRLSRELPIDSLTFTPDLVALALAARGAVASSPGDSVTRTSWDWPAAPTADSVGRIRVAPTGMTSAVRLLVQGARVAMGATVGQTLTLPAGTYEIQAAADRYLAARVSREVLPGVTTVLGFDLTPVARVATLPDTVLPDAVAAVVQGRLVKLTIERYGLPPSCGTGFLVGRAGLVVTSYRTIRGATRVSAELSGGRGVSGSVGVAAHEVAHDLALLHLSAEDTDTLVFAPAPVLGPLTAWAAGFDGCGPARFSRTRVSPAVSGARMALAAPLAGEQSGGPVINQAGSVIGVVVRNDSAASTGHLPTMLAEARLNTELNRLMTPEEVARTENHRLGTLEVRSTVGGASARVRPLESWQWSEAAQEGALPLQFVGPMGRYAVQLLVDGQVQRDTGVTLIPGALTTLAVEPVPVQIAETVPAPAPRVVRRRKSPLPFILAGGAVAGAGVAVFLLLPKDTTQTATQTGSVETTIPVNPP